MQIIWTKPAERDFDAIWEYIEARNPRAAARVGGDILTAVERLAQHPRFGRPGRVPGTREMVIAGRPYIAVYSVEDAAVVVLRVIHGARRWPPSPSGESE